MILITITSARYGQKIADVFNRTITILNQEQNISAEVFNRAITISNQEQNTSASAN